MPELIVTTKYAIGDKAIVVNESGGVSRYSIVRIIAFKNVVPDVDPLGTDIITYTVEYFSPNSVNKATADVLESDLDDFSKFEDDYNSF